MRQQFYLLMANRHRPLGYLELGNNFIRRWWYKSEYLFKYFYYNYYGLKPINLPSSKYHNKTVRLRLHHKANQSDQLKNLNQLRANNQIRNLPRRWPFDRLLSTASTNSSSYVKKYRRTLTNTNFALITLAIQNSISEEQIHWSKLSSLLKQLFNENNKLQNQENEKFSNTDIFRLENFNFNKYIGKGCNAAIYEANLKEPWSDQFKENKFAIKMLFNYSVESNAVSIVNAMRKECIPYEGSFGPEIDSIIEKSRVKLPDHPNIVQMHGVFVDQIPELPKAKELFKNALPPRLAAEGYGRNATLFIVMKLYGINLKEYLKSNLLCQDQSLSLLTQLFTAIAHLYKNNISHRDLKTDNILLDFSLDRDYPALVLTDFGLCSTSLNVPYLTDDMTICGNRALTAPEIITAVPGVFSRLDYRKSDLWASGTIAYEIYNNCNPFYPNENGSFLNSYSYKEEELPRALNMPIYIQTLVREILSRDPSHRPEINVCTTLCNLLMFCDELSLKCIANARLTEKQLIKKINLILSDTLFFARKKLNKMQLKLKLMFLMDLEDLSDVKKAIQYFEM